VAPQIHAGSEVIMTSLRVLALQGADALALSFQSAFQQFGFLSASRESVILRDGDGAKVALLADKSTEGWPAVELPLPMDATFLHATNAVLSRTAVWRTSEPPATALARVTAHFAPAAITVDERAPVPSVTLPALAATIRIGSAPRGTLIAVCQRRRPEDIRRMLTARAQVR
jgi:hypothetical protein